MREFRCSHCHKLLAREYVYEGRLEIKCPECGELNRLFCRKNKPANAEFMSVRKEVKSNG